MGGRCGREIVVGCCWHGGGAAGMWGEAVAVGVNEREAASMGGGRRP